MRGESLRMRRTALRGLVAALAAFGAPCSAANPDMNKDFTAIMQWFSSEFAHGLAFNAGSTFDPPREVTDKRFQPDLSLGVGNLPLDKGKFPALQTPALQDLGANGIFPKNVLFPNLAMHWRMGLPGRSDLAIRMANMTIPGGYQVSPGVKTKAQSNSIGFGVRKHVLGGDWPLLSLGANYNYVFGNLSYKTKFNTNSIQGFSADSGVNGSLKWNVSSFGLNAVASQNFGHWTPFLGLGYNYATGTVTSSLEADSNTPLISPIVGSASQHPEQISSRVIFGTEMDRRWINFFANGEIKTVGVSPGKSWIIHAGATLPFHIWTGGRSGSYARNDRGSERAEAAEPSTVFRQSKRSAGKYVRERAQASPELIFIQ